MRSNTLDTLDILRLCFEKYKAGPLKKRGTNILNICMNHCIWEQQLLKQVTGNVQMAKVLPTITEETNF